MTRVLSFPPTLRGERGADTRRWIGVGAAVITCGLWALVFGGALGGAKDAAVTGLVLVAAAGAAICLVGAARRGDRPLASGTNMFALGALVWFIATLASALGGGDVASSRQGNELAFVLATALMGFACWSVTGSSWSTSTYAGSSRHLALLDGLVIASSIALWWLFTVWEPLLGTGPTALVIGLTFVDGFAFSGALLLWSRSGTRHRPNRACILAALGLIMATDMAYARGVADDASALLGLGWFSVGALLIVASYEPRWTSVLLRHEVSEVARWAQALLAPTVGITVLGLVAVHNSTPASGRAGFYLNASVWLVVVAVLGRQAFLLVEHVVLNRRLRATTAVLARMAEHDDLTGLLDRQAFLDAVGVVLTDREHDGVSGAFVWVHIDGMRRMNDLLGTRVGDRVLIQVAGRLRTACHDDDHLCRYAGDEFILMRPIAGADVDAWADDVRAALDDVFDVDGVSIRVTSAIGVLEFAAGHRDATSLVSDAATTMAEVRTRGRNQITHYTLEGDGEDHDGRLLARDLRTALDNKGLRVHYQPVCDLATGAVLGAEALLRFDHPTRGEVEPDEFLPVAAATGLMPELAMLVLDESCTAFADDAGLGKVSVNLSDSDLADPRLLDWVQATLERTGLDPARLIIELSERVNPEPDVIRGIERLGALGVELALDDFGSSWTSLAQVQQLPIGVVKIDRFMVAALDADDESMEPMTGMIEVVVELANLLGITVLAEGVESERQRRVCERLGVGLGQGFLWAPALPLTAFVRFVATSGATANDPRFSDPLQA